MWPNTFFTPRPSAREGMSKNCLYVVVRRCAAQMSSSMVCVSLAIFLVKEQSISYLKVCAPPRTCLMVCLPVQCAMLVRVRGALISLSIVCAPCSLLTACGWLAGWRVFHSIDCILSLLLFLLVVPAGFPPLPVLFPLGGKRRNHPWIIPRD